MFLNYNVELGELEYYGELIGIVSHAATNNLY